jgi:hypothetical protein
MKPRAAQYAAVTCMQTSASPSGWQLGASQGLLSSTLKTQVTGWIA